MEKIKLVFSGFRKGFGEFGNFLGTIINTCLLFVVFVLGIGLVSLYFKAKKKQSLSMEPVSNKGSYWSNKINRNKSEGDSLKPF